MVRDHKNSKPAKLRKDADICVLCSSNSRDTFRYGNLYVHKLLTAHHYCLLFSSGLPQNGRSCHGIKGFLFKDILQEVKRGQRLKCCHCKRTGATVGCSEGRCRKTYHFDCGLENGGINQFFGSFCSYCNVHKPQQSKSIPIDSNISCSVCYEKIDFLVENSFLQTSCCASGWFHRDCIQQYALNSGYFFKCPLCNNVKTFREHMLLHGINVPQQDASWEMEENAFSELLERPDCGAENCLCPGGRSLNKSRTIWRLQTCCHCGSNAMHIGCEASTSSKKKLWNCRTCSEMLDTIKNNKTSSNKTDKKFSKFLRVTLTDCMADLSNIVKKIERNLDHPGTSSSSTEHSSCDFQHNSFVTALNSNDSENIVGSPIIVNLCQNSELHKDASDLHSSTSTGVESDTEEFIIMVNENTDEYIDVCEIDPVSNVENSPSPRLEVDNFGDKEYVYIISDSESEKDDLSTNNIKRNSNYAISSTSNKENENISCTNETVIKQQNNHTEKDLTEAHEHLTQKGIMDDKNVSESLCNSIAKSEIVPTYTIETDWKTKEVQITKGDSQECTGVLSSIAADGDELINCHLNKSNEREMNTFLKQLEINSGGFERENSLALFGKRRKLNTYM